MFPLPGLRAVPPRPRPLLLGDLELQPSRGVWGRFGGARHLVSQPPPTQGVPAHQGECRLGNTVAKGGGARISCAYPSQVPSYSPVSRADKVRAAAPSRSSLWGSCRRQASIQALLCPTTGQICRIFSLGSFGRLGCRAKLAGEPARSKDQGEASQQAPLVSSQ